jgi:hypothetical protein
MNVLRLFSVALLASAAACFGQPCNPHPLRPNLLPPCPSLLERLGEAAEAGKEFNAKVEDLNREIDAARKRFWKAFPNGPDFNAAEAAFLKALWSKDMYYLMFALPEGMNSRVSRQPNVIGMLGGLISPADIDKFPTNVDNGIRPYARPLFAGWVNALRRVEGRERDGAMATPFILATAIQDKSNYRKAYERARNWAEFMSGGADMSKHLTPQAYMLHQMESDVSWVLEQSKSAAMPDGEAATRDLYNFFEKTFGQKEVLAAATTVLNTPKNSVGGLAKRAEVEIGGFVGSPSPNPYMLFLTSLTRSTPRAYAIAICLDPYALLGGQATAAFHTKEQWVKALSLYDQVVAKYGEATTLAAAGRLRAVAKDDKGGPRGDLKNQGSRYWFQTLLKEPKAPLPELPRFKVSSYDARWLGKLVEVHGAVSRVDLNAGRSPAYATIHFRESGNGRLTAFTPNSGMWQESYGDNFSGLVGKTVAIWGQVQEWGAGAGVRVLDSNQVKVLDVPVAANFTESRPEWLKEPLPTLVDTPEYLAWKKFPAGTKVSYEVWFVNNYQPGTPAYLRIRLSRYTLTLESIDTEQAVVSSQSMIFRGNGPPTRSAGNQSIYKAKQLPVAQPEWAPKNTTGEESVIINGKKYATKWTLEPFQAPPPGDPLTFTKTWTSDEIPGGLLFKHQQTNSNLGDGKSRRTITQTVYAPDEGEPQVTMPASLLETGVIRAADVPVAQPAAAASGPATTKPPATPPAPVHTAPPASVRTATPPAQPRIDTSGMPPEVARQLEISQLYGAVARRAGQARTALAQYQRQQGGEPPADVRGAAGRLDVQLRAVHAAVSARNYSLAEQNLHALEDTVTVIERFLAK